MVQISDLAGFLRSHDRFAVFGHINPDGDAIGCAVAAVLLLKAMGKQAFAFLPGGMPVRYRKFKCSIEVADSADQLPFVPVSGLAVDISAPDRFGNGEPVFSQCEAKCAVDHHATNTGIGELCVVDGKAAACGELICELYKELNISLSEEAAMWLYIAVCTDSGRFGFSSTRGETLDTAAACVRAGADVDMITSVLYRSRTAGHTRLLGDVLHHLHTDLDGKLCWAYITDDMFARAGAAREDNEGIVNYLVEMEGVEVACLAETRGNKVKLSLRSKGNVDVALDVALPMGGGGHACAAGVSVEQTMEEAVQSAMNLAKTALERI